MPYSFWLTMFDALYQSTCIFFICQQAYNDTDIDIFEFGTTCTTACMFVMLLHAAIEMRSWVSQSNSPIKNIFIEQTYNFENLWAKLKFHTF